MATGSAAPDYALTLGELVDRHGPIPFARVRPVPAPGAATEQDLLHAIEVEGALCELVDGTLLEKVMGYEESQLQFRLSYLLGRYWEENKRGQFAGADGPMRLAPGLVRLPDLSFVLAPGGKMRKAAKTRVYPGPPDLAVEIISEGNSPREMKRKLSEYFDSGVREVWYVYPAVRELHVYHSPRRPKVVRWPGIFSDSAVLPGLQLNLRELFGDE